MSGHDEQQATTHKTDIPEGGTATPTSGSPAGVGEKEPVMGSEESQETETRDSGLGGVHGQLTGSNPDAPGYGAPVENEGT
jgi:hypothetical protein